MNRIGILLVSIGLLPVFVSSAAAEGWGTIRGKVVWSGAGLPVGDDLSVTKDQEWCAVARKDAGMGLPKDETLVVHQETKAIKNLFVYMNVRGVPAIHPDYPQDKDAVAKADAEAFEKQFGVKPEELEAAVTDKKIKLEQLWEKRGNVAVVDQLYCQYVPHAVAVREGQRSVFLNYEPVSHNVKVNSFFGNESNVNMPPGTVLIHSWIAESTPLSIECNIHGWMKMYGMVFKHPYFAVTGEDGEFELKNVPAGEIELVIRSPKYILGGRNKYTLTVEPDQQVELVVSYDGDKGTVEKK